MVKKLLMSWVYMYIWFQWTKLALFNSYMTNKKHNSKSEMLFLINVQWNMQYICTCSSTLGSLLGPLLFYFISKWSTFRYSKLLMILLYMYIFLGKIFSINKAQEHLNSIELWSKDNNMFINCKTKCMTVRIRQKNAY
jgi:hypothetical protein